MFLSNLGRTDDDDLHELDFRFTRGDAGRFMFAHHGMNLAELESAIDLRRLGTEFWIVSAEQGEIPVTSAGTRARVDHGRFPSFNLDEFRALLAATAGDGGLDWELAGANRDLTEAELTSCTRWFDDPGEPEQSFPEFVSSMMRSHDNHFFHLITIGNDLLSALIAASIAGYFRHVKPHAYSDVPAALVELVTQQFEGASITAVPFEFDFQTKSLYPDDVFISKRRVSVFAEARTSGRIGEPGRIRDEVIGRQLLISYDLARDEWSFGELRRA
jgi:hypothetical protein